MEKCSFKDGFYFGQANQTHDPSLGNEMLCHCATSPCYGSAMVILKKLKCWNGTGMAWTLPR